MSLFRENRMADQSCRRVKKVPLGVEPLEDRTLLDAGLAAPLSIPPTTATTATLATRFLVLDRAGMDSPSVARIVRMDQWQDLDRITQMHTMIEQMMEQMTPNLPEMTLELGSDPFASKDSAGQDVLWQHDDTFTRFMDAVKAELERLGLSGLARRLGDFGQTGGVASLFGETTSGDPMQRILDQLSSNPFADLMDGELGSIVNGVDVEMAKDVLSVPGLEAFQGQDVFSLDPSANWTMEQESDGQMSHTLEEVVALNVLSAAVMTMEKLSPGTGVAMLAGYGIGTAIDWATEPAASMNEQGIKDGVKAALMPIPIVGQILVATMAAKGPQPLPAPEEHPTPDGIGVSREPINLDPQATLNQLQQPGEETTVDHSLLIDRFVRGVVARLLSTINPAPEGGTPGGVDGGDTSPGPLTNPLGGDPGNDTPTPVVTRDNGPKPIGDPDSPTTGPIGPKGPRMESGTVADTPQGPSTSLNETGKVVQEP